MTRVEVVGFLTFSFLAGSVVCDQVGAKDAAKEFAIAALVVPTSAIAVEVLSSK